MFSIDTEDPRFKNILRIMQYVLLSLLVLGGTVILVLAGQGYDFNRSTGEVIQNGLLLVNTRPEGAVVSIDGVVESDQTPGRYPLPSGNYDIEINREDYRPWTKRVNVQPNSVEWVYYPLLIPIDLTSDRVGAWRNVSFISQSPDPRQALLRQSQADAKFNLINLDGRSLADEEIIELPEAVLRLGEDEKVGTFEAREWSDNGRYILLIHSLGQRQDYIRLDTEEPALSLNLSDLFDLELEKVRFINSSENLLYSVVGRDLRRLDINQQTISAPLVRDVVDYRQMRDRFVAYMSTDNDELKLGVLTGDETKIVAGALAGSADRYRFDVAEFDQDDYLGLLDTEEDALKVWQDPHDRPDAVPLFGLNAPGGNRFSFSRNGQFALVEGGGRFVSYDIDRQRTHRFEAPFANPSERPTEWMDGYRLLAYDQSNKMHVFEFDGANVQDLITADPAFEVFFASEFNGMYAMTTDPSNQNNFLVYTSLLATND